MSDSIGSELTDDEVAMLEQAGIRRDSGNQPDTRDACADAQRHGDRTESARSASPGDRTRLGDEQLAAVGRPMEEHPD